MSESIIKSLVRWALPLRLAAYIKQLRNLGDRRLMSLPSLNRLMVARQFTRRELREIRGFRITSLPEWVCRGYVLGKIIRSLNLNVMPFSPWFGYDLALNFQDNTFSTVDVVSYLDGIYESGQRPPVVNGSCCDISKRHLGHVFFRVFGYSLEIDPTDYAGPVVTKSNNNAAHDGRVIRCPISSEIVDANLSYTVLVDNCLDGMAHDMRVVWFGKVLDFFYLKRRPIPERFSNTNSFVTIETTSSHFTGREIDLIGALASELGLEYGELDCLRDVKTGLLYVVDVSKTPNGPPNGLSRKASNLALRKMSVEFAKMYILQPECRKQRQAH